MTQTFIPGKDAALEDSIARFQAQLGALGFTIEEESWLNPVPHVWSVHIRDRDCPLCFTNGKGATRKAALASALGEYFERLSTNYFFVDFVSRRHGRRRRICALYQRALVRASGRDGALPDGILDDHLRAFYDPDQELTGRDLVNLQSAIPNAGFAPCLSAASPTAPRSTFR